jgi:hypothetical protein
MNDKQIEEILNTFYFDMWCINIILNKIPIIFRKHILKLFYAYNMGAVIVQSIERQATGWTNKESEFESR